MIRFLIICIFHGGSILSKAHSDGHQDLSMPWWTQWNSSSIIIFSLSLIFLLYGLGWVRQKKRFPHLKKFSYWQGGVFILAILTLVTSLLSPVDIYSDFLSWVHMLQHTLLMMVAAPLFAIASPSYMSQWSIPAAFWRKWWLWKWWGKKTFSNFWVKPTQLVVLYGLTLWIWHIPSLYEEALHTAWVHDLQHISFFLTSYWFWMILIDPARKTPLRPELGLMYLFVTSIHSMVLGVLMALSPTVWYEPYLVTAPQFGWDPLKDQQVAGLIMWMPAGITYLIAAIILFLKLLFPTFWRLPKHSEGLRFRKPIAFLGVSKKSPGFSEDS